MEEVEPDLQAKSNGDSEDDLDDSDPELSEEQFKDPIIQAYAQAKKQRAEKISSRCILFYFDYWKY